MMEDAAHQRVYSFQMRPLTPWRASTPCQRSQSQGGGLGWRDALRPGLHCSGRPRPVNRMVHLLPSVHVNKESPDLPVVFPRKVRFRLKLWSKEQTLAYCFIKTISDLTICHILFGTTPCWIVGAGVCKEPGGPEIPTEPGFSWLLWAQGHCTQQWANHPRHERPSVLCKHWSLYLSWLCFDVGTLGPLALLPASYPPSPCVQQPKLVSYGCWNKILPTTWLKR